MSSHDKRTVYNRPLSIEEEKKVFKVGAVLATSSLIFMIGFALLVHYDIVRLHPSNTTAETIHGYAGRVEFTLRYQTLLVFWLVFNTLATIYGRITTKAFNPLEEKSEQRVQLFKNVLTNSFESVITSVFSQLIFVSFATPPTILKVIPLVNIIQFVGRVTFFAGYPLKRAFGFCTTFVPTIWLTAYNVYKFGSFLGAY